MTSFDGVVLRGLDCSRMMVDMYNEKELSGAMHGGIIDRIGEVYANLNHEDCSAVRSQ
jgi:hypothetical protein